MWAFLGTVPGLYKCCLITSFNRTSAPFPPAWDGLSPRPDSTPSDWPRPSGLGGASPPRRIGSGPPPCPIPPGAGLDRFGPPPRVGRGSVGSQVKTNGIITDGERKLQYLDRLVPDMPGNLNLPEDALLGFMKVRTCAPTLDRMVGLDAAHSHPTYS